MSIQSSIQLFPVFPKRKPRILLVSDDLKGLNSVRRCLSPKEIEIYQVDSPKELPRASRQPYDLAILDLCATQLPCALQVLRENFLTNHIPLLVHAARLTQPEKLAGMLPRFRALACSATDIATLIRQQTQPALVALPKPILL